MEIFWKVLQSECWNSVLGRLKSHLPEYSEHVIGVEKIRVANL